jgi:hypothetical protein
MKSFTAATDETVGVERVEEQFNYQNIPSATTTVVKNAPGMLHCITVNATAAGPITIYDNTAASGQKIATLKASIVENTYYFDTKFLTGLTIVTGAASDITVSFR